MNKKIKGQIAIEYIVFIAIFLLFFQAILKPTVDFAEVVITDVQSVSVSKENMTNLANNINSLESSLGYGKRIMFLYLPGNAILTSCSDSALTYEITISKVKPDPPNPPCQNGICTLSEDLYLGSNSISCDVIGPGFTGNVVIEKTQIGDIDVSIQ